MNYNVPWGYLPTQPIIIIGTYEKAQILLNQLLHTMEMCNTWKYRE